MQPLRIVGQSVPRKDALDIVTGNVVYGADISLPGMLYARLLRSSIARGKVTRLDVSRAKTLSGVKAVITAQDVPPTRFGYAVSDETIFAGDQIRYAGEPLAAVAATDEDRADEAIRLIEVDYEESRGVFDVLEALEEGAPLVHEDLGNYKPNPILTRRWNPLPGTNILHQAEFSRGNLELGFRTADYVFEDTFRTRRVHHCYLEPHSCVAKIERGEITVWTPTQRSFVVRATLAAIFGVPEDAIRVIATKIGGGFGGKNGVRLEHYAVALAMKTGSPVKVVMRRTEEFSASAGSVPAVITMKTGVMRDGTITARSARFIWDCGAYGDSLPTSNRALKDAVGPYRIPHLKVTSSLVYTNTLRGCPFRGLGCPESVWAGESQIDMIAHRLGLNPVELRMKNLIQDGDVAPTGEILENVTAKECLRRVVEELEDTTPAQRGSNRGIGISMVYKSPTGPGGVSSAVLTIKNDGTVQLLIGSSDVGGGMETVLSQIVAEELGLALDDISITSGDTSTVPFDYGTYSSRVTVSSGQAVRNAAIQARGQLLDIAAKILAQEASSLALQGRHVVLPRDGGAVPVTAILNNPLSPHKSVTATGSAQEDGKTTGWRFGAQAVELTVDRETGLVTVLKVVSAHDVGRAINPPLVTGQVEGGAVMGLGYALREKLKLDEGRVINAEFSEYPIFFAHDVPKVHSIILESPLPAGPFGAKGVGELADFGIAPAVANAVENAIGVRITELPLDAERVLEAAESQQNFKEST